MKYRKIIDAEEWPWKTREIPFDEIFSITVKKNEEILSKWEQSVGKNIDEVRSGEKFYKIPKMTNFLKIDEKYYRVKKSDCWAILVLKINYTDLIFYQFSKLFENAGNKPISYAKLNELVKKFRNSKYSNSVEPLLRLSKICEKTKNIEAYKLFCMQIDYLKRWGSLHINYEKKVRKHPHGCVETFINLISWVWKFVVIDYTQDGKKHFFDSRQEAESKFGKLNFLLGSVREMQDDVYLAYVGKKPEESNKPGPQGRGEE